MITKFMTNCLVIMLCALALAACGKRGGPFPPEGCKDQYPKQYPAPEEQ